MQLQTHTVTIDSPTHKFTVPFQYQVHFTRGAFRVGNQTLRLAFRPTGHTRQRVLVIVDEGVIKATPNISRDISEYFRAHDDALELVAPPLAVPGGEICKNSLIYVQRILSAINHHRICRHSFVMAIGGGAVLDMAGYAAATAHRGVRLIRLPTTVLSQNDGGVGIKNGINAFGKKNFLGSFAPPFAVVNDSHFLKTLDDRDWRSGLAEAVKVACLKDLDFFSYIEGHTQKLTERNLPVMEAVIARCAQLHCDHIALGGDPFEHGSSRPLDFGHWAAHKLEQISEYRLRHGEAVAIGIALDVLYSHYVGFLKEHDCERVLKTLDKLGFQLFVPELLTGLDDSRDESGLFRGLSEFKEHIGQLCLSFLTEIGQRIEVTTIDTSLYRRAINRLKEYTHSVKQVKKE